MFASALALIRLCARLSSSAYDGTFDGLGVRVVYSSTTCAICQPIFYILESTTESGVLYCAVRGSTDPADFSTDVIFTETRTSYGIFHTGFYNASVFVYQSLEPFLLSGKYREVRLTGHSYGAAVSQVLHVMIHNKITGVDVFSYAFAPVPAMNLAADDEVRKDMFAFVNDDDIVPTLSVPNCYKRFTFLFPTLNGVPSDVIIDRIDGILKIIKFTSLLEEEIFQMVWDAVPIIVNAAKEFEMGEPKYVRYIAGTAYVVEVGNPKTLSDCLTNQEIFLDTLSVSLTCITNHGVENYVQAVDELLEE